MTIIRTCVLLPRYPRNFESIIISPATGASLKITSSGKEDCDMGGLFGRATSDHRHDARISTHSRSILLSSLTDLKPTNPVKNHEKSLKEKLHSSLVLRQVLVRQPPRLSPAVVRSSSINKTSNTTAVKKPLSRFCLVWICSRLMA